MREEEESLRLLDTRACGGGPLITRGWIQVSAVYIRFCTSLYHLVVAEIDKKAAGPKSDRRIWNAEFEELI
jgi:hypothetical protein